MATVWFLLAAVTVTLPIRGESLEVEVPIGGVVSLQGAELQLGSQSGDDCKVQVVSDEPTSQRVGQLSPEIFNCHFRPGEVRYRHNGNPLLDRDIVTLRVYRFTTSETHVDLVVLTIRIVDSRSDTVKLGGKPLTVPKFLAFSEAINASMLTIQTPPSAICTVRLMDGVGFPIAGRLVRKNGKEAGLLKASCSDFLNSGLKYEHLRPPSPQRDYIPISVEIREPESRDVVQSVAVWLPVLIAGAISNQVPHVAMVASLLLEADHFVLTALTTAALDAEDEETARERLVFNVSAAPHGGGFLTHIDRPTRPIASFTWSDLHMLKVAYQPSTDGKSQRSYDQVEFRVIDDFFASSPPIVVHFSVRTSETKAPRVSWNMGLDLLEGQSRPITWKQLQVVDSDNLKNVRLVAVHGPLHGRLTIRGSAGFQFGVAELQSGSVVYHHSDDESRWDHIVFRVSDGRHSVRLRFIINVLPKDDSPPALITNMAAQVQQGGAVRLGQALLLAADQDSSDDHILYRVEAPPSAGRLLRRTSTHHQGEALDWFVQSELLNGVVFYQHSGSSTLHDSFLFSLSDAHDPPNRSHTYTMVILVFPVADELPVESPGAVRSLTLNETDVVPVTAANLHFVDGEDPGADLTYVVTQSCFSPERPELMDAGRLIYVDGPLRKDAAAPALKSFTQLAVDHLKVAFMPPMEDIGVEPLAVRLGLTVIGRHGGNVSGIFLNVSVLPVDDQAPQAFTNPLRVDEGGAAFVTDEHLLLRDPDSREDALRVMLRAAPRHGRLEFPGDAFTLRDLRGLHVRYVHDDSETTEDAVGLTVTDGFNSVAVVLQVQVLPVNDEPPRLSGGLLGGLSCEEGGRVQVTADYLSATDRDSDDDALSYMLARRPARGELQRAGLTVDKFSQQDLRRGLVYYVHTGGEIGPDAVLDVVTLIISDGEACCQGDAPPPPVPLHGSLPAYDLNVTVQPVNDKAPRITLGASVLQVKEGAACSLRHAVAGASDPDSPAQQLTFHLEAPPLHGFLENTLPPAGSEKSGTGVPVETFSSAHLMSGFINYVQSEHKGAEPTVDQLSISVSDGLHRSAPVSVYIIISPTNDEAPLLLLNNFTVIEGGVQELTPSILDAVDLDAPPDVLTFTVLRPPAHGHIVASMANGLKEAGPGSQPISSFTLQQLRQGLRLLYQHDDSETLLDSLTMRLTDGKHTVERTNHITVTPRNDHRPTLTRNKGLEVDPDQLLVISSLVLESEDLDSDPEQVFYVLDQTPKYGTLRLKIPGSWLDLVSGQNFSQESVNQNQVWYQHKSQYQNQDQDQDQVQHQDSFRFKLTDQNLDQNLDQNQQTFFISVRNTKKVPGDISLQMTSPMRVSAGGRLVVSTDVLLASDSATPPEQLVVTVTVPPRRGLLHDVRRPGVPLTRFTLLDVAAQRVYYTHDDSRHGDDDTFSFMVSNGVSSIAGSVLVLIQHGHPTPPALLINAPLLVSSGGAATIGPTHLLLSDGATPPCNLTYRVTRPPLHGRLFLREAELVVPPFVFTQQDVNRRDVGYRHRPGSPAGLDSFLFLPEGGANQEDRLGVEQGRRKGVEPVKFNIQVHIVDRSSPSVSTLMSPSVVTRLSDGRHGILVTARHLKASDPDSPARLLEFIITTAPRHGYLQNTATGSYISTRFTQHDVNQRIVVYVLPDDVAVTTDSFMFRVVDPAGNSSPLKTLQVFWSRVELSTSCFRVCRSEAELIAVLRRSGRSQEPAYVRVQVEEGSAKVGKDFLPIPSGLVQFDPGVLEKRFPLRLLPPRPHDDTASVNRVQTLVLVLQEVDNVVLGATSSASVQLLRQSGGRCEDQDWKDVTPPPSNDRDLDLEAELIWEDLTPPPRGDVPNRRPFYEEGAEPQELDQEQDQNQNLNLNLNLNQNQDQVWQVHGLIPLQLEVRDQDQNQDQDQDQIWQVHGLIPLQLEVLDQDQNQNQNPEDPMQKCHGGVCYQLSSSVASCCSAQRTCSMRGGALPSSTNELTSWLWNFVTHKKPFWTLPESGRVPDVGVSCVLVEGPGRRSFSDCSDQAEHAFVCEAPAPRRHGDRR